ncbi:FIMAH domain-containing protein [Actinoplanes sp. CA-015351]|uniref:FIMAH domain-containing protein n=1 Tax=Actinoplanes sp. CA-015351 TaxID=3239897 RepID=UPI003D95544E
MSVPHDPYYSPTTKLPGVKPQGANQRLKILGAVTAATVLFVTVAVAIISSGGDDDPESPAVPIAAPSVVITEDAPLDEPSAAPTSTSPTPKPPTAVPAGPAELVTQLATVVRALEKRGELDRKGAEALNRRLEQLKTRLRKDPEKASRKLAEFVKKLADLREDEDISEAGFQTLAAGATQIGAALPSTRDN